MKENSIQKIISDTNIFNEIIQLIRKENFYKEISANISNKYPEFKLESKDIEDVHRYFINSLHDFFDNYPLYKKYNNLLPIYWNELYKISMKKYCENCKDIHTFKIIPRDTITIPIQYRPLKLNQKENITFTCQSCNKYNIEYFIKINYEEKYMMKIGQDPSQYSFIKKDLSKYFSKDSHLFQKGLACETESFGIGAFAYYRRIVELKINELLNEIKDLLEEDKKNEFQKALDEIHTQKRIVDKIKLVKDLLPSHLIIDNINPLKVLYDALSIGIHQSSDEKCLENAILIREVLIMLMKNLKLHKNDNKKMTDSMKKLLDKQSEKIKHA